MAPIQETAIDTVRHSRCAVVDWLTVGPIAPHAGAIKHDDKGHSLYVKLNLVVGGFSSKPISKRAQASLLPGTLVTSDGLGCFAAVADANCIHLYYLAAFVYRFNWRFDLCGHAARLIVDVARSKPINERGVRTHAEPSCGSSTTSLAHRPPIQTRRQVPRLEDPLGAWLPDWLNKLLKLLNELMNLLLCVLCGWMSPDALKEQEYRSAAS